MTHSFNQSTRALARQQGVEARAEGDNWGEPNLLRVATVTAVTGDSYTVAVGLDPDATIDDPENPGQQIPKPPLKVYTRIYCIPEASLTVGQLVWLHFQPGEQDPVIMATGGGTPCYQSLFMWAVLP